MKLRLILSFIILVCLLLNCKSKFPISSNNATLGSYDDKWIFFELDKPTRVRVISHLRSPTLCGNLAFASVSIVESEDGKTFRVLDLCNNSNYENNSTVKLIPAKKPEFNVLLPSRKNINPITKKVENSKLDVETIKTTYAQIESLAEIIWEHDTD